MHAVSQGAEPAKAPCIYAQLEASPAIDDDDSQEGPNDIRLIPSDAACRALYDSMPLLLLHCQVC